MYLSVVISFGSPFNPKPVMRNKAVVPQSLCLQLPTMAAWV
jgi:hypothetical protein